MKVAKQLLQETCDMVKSGFFEETAAAATEAAELLLTQVSLFSLFIVIN